MDLSLLDDLKTLGHEEAAVKGTLRLRSTSSSSWGETLFLRLSDRVAIYERSSSLEPWNPLTPTPPLSWKVEDESFESFLQINAASNKALRWSLSLLEKDEAATFCKTLQAPLSSGVSKLAEAASTKGSAESVPQRDAEASKGAVDAKASEASGTKDAVESKVPKAEERPSKAALPPQKEGRILASKPATAITAEVGKPTDFPLPKRLAKGVGGVKTSVHSGQSAEASHKEPRPQVFQITQIAGQEISEAALYSSILQAFRHEYKSLQAIEEALLQGHFSSLPALLLELTKGMNYRPEWVEPYIQAAHAMQEGQPLRAFESIFLFDLWEDHRLFALTALFATALYQPLRQKNAWKEAAWTLFFVPAPQIPASASLSTELLLESYEKEEMREAWIKDALERFTKSQEKQPLDAWSETLFLYTIEELGDPENFFEGLSSPESLAQMKRLLLNSTPFFNAYRFYQWFFGESSFPQGFFLAILKEASSKHDVAPMAYLAMARFKASLPAAPAPQPSENFKRYYQNDPKNPAVWELYEETFVAPDVLIEEKRVLLRYLGEYLRQPRSIRALRSILEILFENSEALGLQSSDEKEICTLLRLLETTVASLLEDCRRDSPRASSLPALFRLGWFSRTYDLFEKHSEAFVRCFQKDISFSDHPSLASHYRQVFSFEFAEAKEKKIEDAEELFFETPEIEESSYIHEEDESSWLDAAVYVTLFILLIIFIQQC